MESLNWQAYLSPAHYNVPLHALLYSLTRKLGLYLNQEQVVENDDGIIPDFGGLAELVGFDGLEIQDFERAQDPGKAVLNLWKNRPDLQPTVGRLVELLARMGREDILTDLSELIRSDVLSFLERPGRFQKEKPIQDETVSPGPGYEEVPEHITVDDVTSCSVTKYDAFVCYNPFGKSSADLDFVRQIIQRFENSPINYKLFVPGRDDLAGLNTHVITAKIISERCRHMIVILSNNFLQSEACNFQSTFAHCLSPGARSRRIVPVKIDDCPIPNIMRIMAVCDFTKGELCDWAWTRLKSSIAVPLQRDDFTLVPSSSFDLNSSVLPMSTLLPSSSQSAISEISSARDKTSGSDSAFESGSSSGSTLCSSQSWKESDPAISPDLNHSKKAPATNIKMENTQSHTSPCLVTTAATDSSDRKIQPSSPSLAIRTMNRFTERFSNKKHKSAAKKKAVATSHF